MNSIRDYFQGLTQAIATNWNRFWFTPSDPINLGAMRLLVGAMAFYFILSYSGDLTRWFGPHGLLTIPTVTRLTGLDDPTVSAYRISVLYYVDQPAALWAVHGIALGVAAMCMLGLFTRVTTILTFLFVLSYIHRAPMITGQLEPVLTMLLLYLCIGPAGRELSLDRWRSKSVLPAASTLSTSATISLRLMQVHVVMFYAMMGLTKLAGEPWWNGEAVWWLMAHSESRLIDFTWVGERRGWPLFNFWSHAIVIYELSFALLIWNRWARPLLLVAGVLIWLSLIPLTGLTSFAVTMLVANAAFVPAAWWREILRGEATKERASQSPLPSEPAATVAR